MSVQDLLTAPTIEAISSKIDEQNAKVNSSLKQLNGKGCLDTSKDTDITSGKIESRIDCSDPDTSAESNSSSKNLYQNNAWTCMLVQWLPLGFIYPFKYAQPNSLFMLSWIICNTFSPIVNGLNII